MDLLELFERDTPERGRRPAGGRRKGLRGLFDRLTAALEGDGDDDQFDRKDRHARDRRRRDDVDLGFD